MRKLIYYMAISVIAAFLLSCNDESALLPSKDASQTKLLIGEGIGDIPINISFFMNGDYLISSNSSFLGGAGNSLSKIRLIRVRPNGVIVYDKYYPEENDESWSARSVSLLPDENILVGANNAAQEALLLKFNSNADSIQFNSNYQSQYTYLSHQQSEGKVIAMVSDGPNNVLVREINLSTLALESAFEKSFAVDSLPSSSLFIKNDTLAFATQGTVNFALWNAPNDLPDDARLSDSLKLGNIQVKGFSSLQGKNTALCFGEQSNSGNVSKIFYAKSSPINNEGAISFSIYDKESGGRDVLYGVKEEANFILLCGARLDLGNSNSKFLLIKANSNGNELWSAEMGSFGLNNAVYDAVYDGNNIITIGTTNFEGIRTLIMNTLSADDGKLIR